MEKTSVPLKVKQIHLVNQHMSYKKRYRAFRKTLSFRERHFSPEYGVIPFGYLSYKMWLTKIWGGAVEKFQGLVGKTEGKK